MARVYVARAVFVWRGKSPKLAIDKLLVL